MKLVNPKTKEVFEVEDAHGNMLLSQGFYKEAPKAVKRKTSASNSKED